MTPVPCPLREVAALCVSGRSAYKHIAGVLAFDHVRDARTFRGGVPVVAHPPCRCWSKCLRHQARPVDRGAEMDLGRWCVDQVLRHGGVLEQPAGSLLWKDRGLPCPGDMADPFLYTVYIEQRWFGFPTPKPTWVLVAGVPARDLAPVPFKLRGPADLALHFLNKEARSVTVPALADWLVSVARSTWHSLPCRPYKISHVSGASCDAASVVESRDGAATRHGVFICGNNKEK